MDEGVSAWQRPGLCRRGESLGCAGRSWGRAMSRRTQCVEGGVLDRGPHIPIGRQDQDLHISQKCRSPVPATCLMYGRPARTTQVGLGM